MVGVLAYAREECKECICEINFGYIFIVSFQTVKRLRYTTHTEKGWPSRLTNYRHGVTLARSWPVTFILTVSNLLWNIIQCIMIQHDCSTSFSNNYCITRGPRALTFCWQNCCISIISIPYVKFEVNRRRNLRWDSVRKLGWKMKKVFDNMQKKLNQHKFHK